MGRLCDESSINDGEFVVWFGTHDNGEDEADVFDTLEQAEKFMNRIQVAPRDKQITWDDNDKAVRGWFDCR